MALLNPIFFKASTEIELGLNTTSSKSFIEDEEYFNGPEFFIFCSQFFKPVCVWIDVKGVVFGQEPSQKKDK